MGFWLAGFFVALLAGDKDALVVNHRWDSAALSVAGVTLLAAGLRSGNRWLVASTGAAAAYAAWTTPPVALLLAPMLVWSFWGRRWTGVVSLSTGAATVSLLAGGALLVTGSLGPMLRHFAWTASQYSAANRSPYGSITGGYSALFAGIHGWEMWVCAIIVFFIVLRRPRQSARYSGLWPPAACGRLRCCLSLPAPSLPFSRPRPGWMSASDL